MPSALPFNVLIGANAGAAAQARKPPTTAGRLGAPDRAIDPDSASAPILPRSRPDLLPIRQQLPLQADSPWALTPTWMRHGL
jgi:hypothetical protein